MATGAVTAGVVIDAGGAGGGLGGLGGSGLPDASAELGGSELDGGGMGTFVSTPSGIVWMAEDSLPMCSSSPELEFDESASGSKVTRRAGARVGNDGEV